MRWGSPELFFVLLAPLLAVGAWLYGSAARRRAIARAGDAPLVARLLAAHLPQRRLARQALLGLALTLLCVAALRPQLGRRPEALRRTGVEDETLVLAAFRTAQIQRDHRLLALEFDGDLVDGRPGGLLGGTGHDLRNEPRPRVGRRVRLDGAYEFTVGLAKGFVLAEELSSGNENAGEGGEGEKERGGGTDPAVPLTPEGGCRQVGETRAKEDLLDRMSILRRAG